MDDGHVLVPPNGKELLAAVLEEAGLPVQARNLSGQDDHRQMHVAVLLLALLTRDPHLYSHSCRVRLLTHHLVQVLVAIADAFEVMTSCRPCQTPRTPTQALEELRTCAGTQFDPVLVDRFCTSLEADLSGTSPFETGRCVGFSARTPPALVRPLRNNSPRWPRHMRDGRCVKRHAKQQS